MGQPSHTINSIVINIWKIYSSSLQRLYNFNYSLNHILGNDSLTKLGHDNGKKISGRLREEITRQNFLPTALTADKIRQLLHKIGRNDLFKFTTLILSEVSGIKPPLLTHEQREQINYVFSCISDHLPKSIHFPFLIYEISDLILPKGPNAKFWITL